VLPRTPEREWSTWVMYIDENFGTPYYYNAKTGETTWEEPPVYVKEQSAAEWEDQPASPKPSSSSPSTNHPQALTLAEAISLADRYQKKTLKIYVEIAPPAHLLMVNKPASSPSPVLPRPLDSSSSSQKQQQQREESAVGMGVAEAPAEAPATPQPSFVNPFEQYAHSNPFATPFDPPRNQNLSRNPFIENNPTNIQVNNEKDKSGSSLDFSLDEFNPFIRWEAKNPFGSSPLTMPSMTDGRKWTCETCTLENTTVNFCSACGASRPQPLFGGGHSVNTFKWSCSKCTFLNDIAAMNCESCGQSKKAQDEAQEKYFRMLTNVAAPRHSAANISKPGQFITNKRKKIAPHEEGKTCS